jgi:hypothetical protein
VAVVRGAYVGAVRVRRDLDDVEAVVGEPGDGRARRRLPGGGADNHFGVGRERPSAAGAVDEPGEGVGDAFVDEAFEEAGGDLPARLQRDGPPPIASSARRRQASSSRRPMNPTPARPFGGSAPSRSAARANTEATFVPTAAVALSRLRARFPASTCTVPWWMPPNVPRALLVPFEDLVDGEDRARVGARGDARRGVRSLRAHVGEDREG